MPNMSRALPTLRQVIDDHLEPADPRVLTAHDRLDVPVGWVHSSEIFEIGPLLSGGELLLTTGLGLAGLDPGTRRHYVRDLAERGVVGIAFETGRSFDAVPDEMIAAGSQHRVPIIELRRIVPFIDVCRAANTAIVSDEVSQWRRRATLDAALHQALGGGGVATMLGHLADAIDGPTILIGTGGALLAAHGVDDDRAAWRLVDDARASVTIEVRGREVGRLIAGPAEQSDLTGEHLDTLLSMAAGPVGAALTRPGAQSLVAGPQLLSDVIAGRPVRRADLAARLGNSGVTMTASTLLVPVAAESPDARMAASELTRAAASIGVRIVHAVVDATTYAVVIGFEDASWTADDPIDGIVGALDRGGAGAGRVTVAVGGAIAASDFGYGPGLGLRLGSGLRSAAEQLAIAVGMVADGSAARRVFTARELAADVAVRRIVDADRSDLLDLIAPLAAQDETASTQLVRTIDVHLRHGCSATKSAEALHIGRQSLYQRLDRIRTLLGFDPTAPEVYPSILLAVSALRAERAH